MIATFYVKIVEDKNELKAIRITSHYNFEQNFWFQVKHFWVSPNGAFKYYVSTFLEIFDPPPRPSHKQF